MFLQSLAHDLRTPLNTIINMNEHLMLQYPNKKIVQSTMKLSLSSCKFQIQMVEMIQELSKMQVKQFVLENTLFDFREKLND